MQDRTRYNILTYMIIELHFKIMILLQLCNGKLIFYIYYLLTHFIFNIYISNKLRHSR